MSGRIKTLLLEANGTHWVAVCIDTLGGGRLTRRADAPAAIARSPLLRKLFGDRYATASYIADWLDAFKQSPALDTETCNITNLLEFRRSRPKIQDYDLVVVLHSAAGDRMDLLERTAGWFQGRRGKLAVFIGNEYDLMNQKIGFVRASGADVVCSQLPLDVATQLYAESGASVVAMPHALNPAVYAPPPADSPRPIHIGFVGDLYDRLIGDCERSRMVEHFRANGAALGLRCEIRHERMPRDEWAAFLRSCLGVVGAESGTYYLQRSGDALRCARACLSETPDASFDAVFARCFAHARDVLNGKAVSSRHFEPIGTRTCQLLIEGSYNGILDADVHYIAVRRDLSNIDDALRRFRDPAYRERIVDTAFAHVIGRHTYAHRVRDLVTAMFGHAA
jgi:hypothetical protein